MEDYKKKYEDLRKNIEHLHESVNSEWRQIIENYVPELKEISDEEIRKSLLKYLKESFNFDGEIIYPEVANWIDWLEKQTIDISSFPEEQRKYMEKYVNLDKTTLVKLLAERDENIDESLKASICDECEHPTLNCGNFPCDKVKPKFEAGDWVIHKETGIVHQIKQCVEMGTINTYGYDLVGGEYISTSNSDKYRLWSIKDAKDGDMLVNGSNIFIFHCIDTTRLMGYCHVNTDDGRFYDDIGKNECFCLIDAVVIPASKEQRELLFSKMNKAGYVWDPEQKELKQLKQNTAWNEDDEKTLNSILNDLSQDVIPDDEDMQWLKSLKERIKGEQL